jgi:hypothetical protein
LFYCCFVHRERDR